MELKVKIILVGIFLLGALKVFAQEVIPNEFRSVNLTYIKDGIIVNENFDSPLLKNQSLFTPVVIDKSPRDPSRNLANLPNYGLSAFHHWLFGEVVLRNAQMFYAICVGEVKAEQRRLRIKPLITDSNSSLRSSVDNILGYHVPFLAVQNANNRNFPPTKEDAIAHTFAAIDTINVTVANLVACEAYRDSLIRRRR